MGAMVDHVPKEGVNTWQSNIIHLLTQPPCLIIQDNMFFFRDFYFRPNTNKIKPTLNPYFPKY